ncbi:MAG: endonuclease/exonuclease/phosphatase family protein [Dongiaceae bacterium]
MTVFLLLASMLATLNAEGWLGDLLGNFRPHYLVLAALLLIPAILRLNFLQIILLGLIFAINMAALNPLPTAPEAPEAPGQALKVLSFNLWRRNEDHEKLLDYLRRRPVDVAVLVEANAAWQEDLQRLKDVYPYSLGTERDLRGGTYILSRHPFKRSQWLNWPNEAQPGLITELTVGGKQITIVGVHLLRPLTPSGHASREEQIDLLIELAKALKGPVLVAGDFNTVPWSKSFAKIIEKSDLRPATSYDPGFTTWPIRMPFLTFLPISLEYGGIPIDHMLLQGGLEMIRIEKGPDLKSDHRPILAEVVIR